jgi:flagella basal body P-ring formation protein FlgA
VVREQRWLSPSMAAAGEGAIGQVVRGRIGAGEVVLGRDVEPPMVARRGDVVSVDCLAGGLVVRTTARATENGREGEVITLQALNSKRTFRARMDGPGRAVLLADGPAERIGR